MLHMHSLRGAGLSAICEVTFELRGTVLKCVYLPLLKPVRRKDGGGMNPTNYFPIQSSKLCRDNFEEVLEHVLSFVRLSVAMRQ